MNPAKFCMVNANLRPVIFSMTVVVMIFGYKRADINSKIFGKGIFILFMKTKHVKKTCGKNMYD